MDTTDGQGLKTKILASALCMTLHVCLFLCAPSAVLFGSLVTLGLLLGAVGVLAWSLAGPSVGCVSLFVGLVHLAYFKGHSPNQPEVGPLSNGALVLVFAHAAGFYLLRRSRKLATDRALQVLDLDEKLNATTEKLRRKRDYSATLVTRLAKFPELRQSCEQLGRCLKQDQLTQALVNEALRLNEAAQSATLYLNDPQAGQLMLAARARRYENLPPPSVSGDAFDRYVFKSQKPYLSGSGATEDGQPEGKGREASFVITPLLQMTRTEKGTQAATVGVLRVSSNRENAFARDELELLNIVGDLGAMALGNVTLYERTEALAITDVLTGLLTKFEFRTRMTEEMARADREKREISMVMIDVDHFKPYNDTYGHQAGDQVLRRLGELLREAQQPGDLMGRYGGEEFSALVMTDLDGAGEIAERLRQDMESEIFLVGEKESRVTISLGVAAFHRHAKDREGLIRAADEALYASKAQGRNRVTVAPDRA